MAIREVWQGIREVWQRAKGAGRDNCESIACAHRFSSIGEQSCLIGERNLRDGLRCPRHVCSEHPSCLSSSSERSGILRLHQCLLLEIELLLLLQSLLLLNQLYQLWHVLLRISVRTYRSCSMAQEEHKEVHVRDSGRASAIAVSAMYAHNNAVLHTHTRNIQPSSRRSRRRTGLTHKF